jgi:hypothetical protein
MATIILDGQEYPLVKDPWDRPAIRVVPPGWVKMFDAAPLYGLNPPVLYARVYAGKVPGIRVLQANGYPLWYVAPPSADYTPPPPDPIQPIGENLEGLPIRYRNALRRAGCRTRNAVATTPDDVLVSPDKWGGAALGKIGLRYVRARIPYQAPGAAPLPYNEALRIMQEAY